MPEHRQGVAPRGLGVNLRTIKSDRPEFEQLQLPGDLQHLDEQRFDFLQEASPESAQGGMKAEIPHFRE